MKTDLEYYQLTFECIHEGRKYNSLRDEAVDITTVKEFLTFYITTLPCWIAESGEVEERTVDIIN